MMEIKDIPIDDIETALSGCSDAVHTGSLTNEVAPPKKAVPIRHSLFL